eukprot:1810604-Rhodomonas_salina.1
MHPLYHERYRPTTHTSMLLSVMQCQYYCSILRFLPSSCYAMSGNDVPWFATTRSRWIVAFSANSSERSVQRGDVPVDKRGHAGVKRGRAGIKRGTCQGLVTWSEADCNAGVEREDGSGCL